MYRVYIPVITWFLLVACGRSYSSNSESQLSGEGFTSIYQLENKFHESFLKSADCGGIRIHRQKMIFLTALHCLAADLVERGITSSKKAYGLGQNADSIAYFDHRLAGVDIGTSTRILASGNCYTGYGLDALDYELQRNGASGIELVEEATECMLKDWAIVEKTYADGAVHPKQCLGHSENDITSGTKILIMGNPEGIVHRNGAPQTLLGHVYSNGAILDSSLLNDSRYKFLPLWTTGLKEIFFKLITNQRYFVSDADAIPGMSGGPTLLEDGTLIGVTTHQLKPNYSPGSSTRYLWGSHGGISVMEIFNQDARAKDFFDCQ